MSNLRLASRAVRGEPTKPHLFARSANEKVGTIPESQILVELYDSARMYFSKNC